MRCYICNRVLSEKEIQLEGKSKLYTNTQPELKTEPCGECLEAIYDAAYPSGFDPEDDPFVLIDEREEMIDLRDVVPFYKSSTGEEE